MLEVIPGKRFILCKVTIAKTTNGELIAKFILPHVKKYLFINSNAAPKEGRKVQKSNPKIN